MIYFDNAATTKPSRSALDRANVFNQENFYNPSTLYSGGLNCAKEIKTSKESLLKNIGAINHELIFTSCGSESDNMAIFCSVKRGTFVTCKGEHSAVYKSFLELKNRGLNVEFIDLNPDGTVNVDKLLAFAKTNKIDFLSIVHVNNETGGINDVNYIGKKIKEINAKTTFHVDGVQSYGKLQYKLGKEIDLYSISAHKINGLKGVGALIRKKGVNLSPLIFGGGQENGLRSGTENVFGIKVFEYTAEEKYSNLKDNFEKVSKIKEYVKNNLDKDNIITISGENSSPYILTVSAVGLRGEVVMHTLETEGVIIGNGSACSSKNRYSRVIEACGYSSDVLDGVIRISFSTESTISEAEILVEKLNANVKKLKGILS
ncbi:MAG: aminotransferase class V-fold PLP-dependent enzyme [Clostridia bacterium]|nr:aminotransferase class V-fold PLP-dependent enzyme [Clostridia bacterium]